MANKTIGGIMIADAVKEIEIEADGFITREQDLLERVDANRAKPVSDCPYPECERCDKYHGHYCTVPMVVSKQIWLTTESLITRMEKRLTELENLVTEEIIGSKRDAPREDLNLTWSDYFRENSR
jgi:hypothetical protein